MGGKLRTRILQLIQKYEQEKGKRVTQVEIANCVGVSEPTIIRWIRNDLKRLDSRTVEKLCKFFNCEVGDLLYIEDESEAE